MSQLAYIVHTCDSYRFCWKPWWYFFKKYWDFELPVNIYFASETQTADFGDQVKTMTTGYGHWSDRLIRILDALEEPYIIYTQEDFCLSAPVQSDLFNDLFNLFRAENMDVLRLAGFKWTKKDNGNTLSNRTLNPTTLFGGRIFHYDISNPYLHNHQLSLTKKDFFRHTLQPGESPWENESRGTELLRKENASIYLYVDETYPISYHTIVSRGTFNSEGMAMFIRHGLIDERNIDKPDEVKQAWSSDETPMEFANHFFNKEQKSMSRKNIVETVSIIVPTFNRSHTLRRNLECLEKQTFDLSKLEVVVIDDHSQDDTIDMLAHYTGPLRLRFEKNPDGAPDKYGYISCQNHGLKLAKNELCIFIDDDLLAHPRLVEEHVNTHNAWFAKGEEVVCRGWRTEEFDVEDLDCYSFEEDSLYNWKLRYYMENQDDLNPTMCIGNNFSVLRKNALAVRGFGVDQFCYGQDRRIPIKCKTELGLRIVTNVKAFGSHIPHDQDALGKRAGKNFDQNERSFNGRLICLLNLAKAYIVDRRADRVGEVIKEAEELNRQYFDSNEQIAQMLEELRRENC